MELTQWTFLGQNWRPYLAGGCPDPLPQHEQGPRPLAPEPNAPPFHEQWGPLGSRVEATQRNIPLHRLQGMPAPTPFPISGPAIADPLTEPIGTMGASFLPVEVPLPVQSLESSPYAFQPYLEPMSWSPPFHTPSNSSFFYPFTEVKTLPPWSQFATHHLPPYELRSPEPAPEMPVPSYGQDFTRRTPIPPSSSCSCSGSQGSSVWDSCSITDTSLSSLSSLSDGTSQALGSETGHKKTTMTGSAPGSKAASQPIPIDAEGNVWEVDMLLGKWTRGGTTWYLVKWKGFHDKDSTWEKRRDIGAELVDEFEASYEGNHFAIERLLGKRARHGRIEYLVEWKGPGGDNSWEKEADISRARIVEFEGGQ
ncbi:hypothetical protein F5883DRAFT_179851 [Diaporthe sp. PMI_573]|nr:hypothetical protein F5883DRAFT_179851 [Diaporthaceae sp. PMI_573]